MYLVAFIKIFISKNNYNPRTTEPDQFEQNVYSSTEGMIGSIKQSVDVFKLLLTPLPLPIMSLSQQIVKNSLLFLIAPIGEALDIVLDGLYIVQLARVLNRFWIKAKIIRIMLNVYFLSVAKDIVLHIALLIIFFQKSFELTAQVISLTKTSSNRN